MRVRGKGESRFRTQVIIYLFICASLLQFRRFQTELEDEFGDDVQVVSIDLSCLHKFVYLHPSSHTGRDEYSNNYRVL